MKTILITEEYANHYETSGLATQSDRLVIITNDNFKTIQKLKQIENTAVHIYDITETKDKNTLLCVSEHINFSGTNPLIGNQKHIDKPFIDISDLYTKNKDHLSVVTSALGSRYKKEKNNFQYPSTYLCHIAIMARATGKTKITGILRKTN